MKGVQCYELFGGIALKIHIFIFILTKADGDSCRCMTLNQVSDKYIYKIQSVSVT